MSTSSVGKAVELEVKKIIQSQGFQVEKSVHTIWQRRDFFGVFDLICKSKKTNRYVQVKYIGDNTDYSVGIFLEPIKKFAIDHGHAYESFELWIKLGARMVGRGKDKKKEKAKFMIYYVNSEGQEIGKEEFYASKLGK